MKNILIFIVFLLGATAFFTGQLFKIMHWPYGAVLIFTGAIVLAVGGILLLIKLLNAKNQNSSLKN